VLTCNNYRKGAKPKHAKKGAPEHSLIESIHAPEKHVLGEEHSAHEFEVSFGNIDPQLRNSACDSQVTLEPSSYTLEKYQLFEAYQASIHKDSSYPSSFKRFLVETPLVVSFLLL
jgi:arginine-tRNA-protein transferase